MSPTWIKELVVVAGLNSYDWIPRFWDTSELKGPRNTELVMGPRRDDFHGPEYYLEKGLHALHCHLTYSAVAGVPFEKRANFSGREFFLEATGSKQFSQYTTSLTDYNSDVNKCKRQFFSKVNGRLNSCDTKEIYGGEGWYPDKNLEAYYNCWTALGEEAVNRGMIIGGDYGSGQRGTDGFELDGIHRDTALYDALVSPSAAYNAFKNNYNDPFLRGSLYNHGVHRIINQYFRGKLYQQERLFELVIALGLARMIRQQTGVSYKLISFTQNIVSEFTKYATFYWKALAAGGHIQSLYDAAIPPNIMDTIFTYLAQDCDVVWDFTDPQMLGSSETTLNSYDGSQGSSFNFLNDGTANFPDRTSPLGFYGPRDNAHGKNGGPHPSQPMGLIDKCPVSFNRAGELDRWVGTKDWVYPAIYANNTQYSPGPGHTFARVMRDNNLPYVRAYRNPQTGKGWFSYHYAGGSAPLDVVLTVDTVQQSFKCLPGQPQWFLFESPVLTN